MFRLLPFLCNKGYRALFITVSYHLLTFQKVFMLLLMESGMSVKRLLIYLVMRLHSPVILRSSCNLLFLIWLTLYCNFIVDSIRDIFVKVS